MIIAFKPDSTVAITTNSSSELFTFNGEQTVETCKQLIEEIIAIYNKANNTNYRYEHMLEEPVMGVDYAHFEELVYYIYDDYLAANDFPSRKEYWRAVEEWQKERVKTLKAEYANFVFIRSTDDNSVPWDILEGIENILSAERIHLG